jgi:hypothetical protein
MCVNLLHILLFKWNLALSHIMLNILCWQPDILVRGPLNDSAIFPGSLAFHSTWGHVPWRKDMWLLWLNNPGYHINGWEGWK